MNTEYNRDTAIKAIADLHTRVKQQEEKQQLIKDIQNADDNLIQFCDKLETGTFLKMLNNKNGIDYKEYKKLRFILNKLEDLYTKKYR